MSWIVAHREALLGAALVPWCSARTPRKALGPCCGCCCGARTRKGG